MSTNDFLTIEQVAVIARVSPVTVRRWIRSGKLACVRPGRRMLVPHRSLERLLGQATISSASVTAMIKSIIRENRGIFMDLAER
jgi:excisionase family DNA binding protein